MRLSRWVAAAPRTTRAAFGGALFTAWALVLALLLVVTTGVPAVPSVGVAVGVGLFLGLLLLAVDRSSRRGAARRVGWSGDPDYFARVRVDVDHGVLPAVEPARELAYRWARLSWQRRWVTWSLAAVVGVSQLGAAAAMLVLLGSGSAAVVWGYGTLTAIFFYPAFVVLPRHRRVIRAVEGR